MELEDLAKVVRIANQMIAKEVTVETKEICQTKTQVKEEADQVAPELSLQSKNMKLYTMNLGGAQKPEAELESQELMAQGSVEALKWTQILVKNLMILLNSVTMMALEK